jgi:hypothetical protein
MKKYERLIHIEQSFGTKLPSVSIHSFSNEDKKAFNKLSMLIGHGYYTVEDPEGFTIKDKYYYSRIIDGLNNMEQGTYLSIESKEPASIDFLNKEIILGREQVSMLNAKIARTNKMNFAVTIMPENAILIYHYEKTGLFKLSEEKVIL